ncbi:hypothetical protein [Evansella tamaricis]|uniref:Uncharacterized protein n=1 Tax=Evansella tamaricis TaxID=2069301 RepID=A0ABS6JKB7_9BACI|nr:hypothetical protein [Evansella tamaricis]MBU9714102.1 hypothetical protein [Evansella tamaricis]
MIYEKIMSDFKPTYREEFHWNLFNSLFLQEYGNIIKMIIDSNDYWNRLRQRIDFLVYIAVLQISSEDNIMPHEIDPMNADALFTLMETKVKELAKHPQDILIDEVFRQFVRYTKGQFKASANYEYFTAPYFNSIVYDAGSCNGTLWLDELTKEIFDKPLDQFVEELLKNMK